MSKVQDFTDTGPQKSALLTSLRKRWRLAFLASLSLVLAALMVVLVAPAPQVPNPEDSSGEWKSIGPFGINGPPYAPTHIMSGPVGAIGYSPSSPSIMYTGAGPFSPAGMGTLGSRGLWKSTDGGQTWNLTQGLSSSRVYAVLVSPNDPNILIVQATAGILKSTDGGQTWQTTHEEWGYILFQDSNSVVFGTTSNSVLRSSDFGSTWQNLGSVANFHIEAAAFVDGGRTIYLGGWQEQGSSYRVTLMRSMNGGADFSTVRTVVAAEFNAIAVAPQNLDVIWIATFASYETTGGLYHSTDGGTSWTSVSTPSYSPQYVALDPQNPNVVYVGNDAGVYRSVDGGPIEAVLRGFDTRTIGFGETNATILVGTDQGLFVTNDGGATWDGLNGRANNLITSVAATGSRIIFEAQDYTRPIVSCDNGSSWTSYPYACTTINGRTQESGFVTVDPYNDSWVMIYAEPVGLSGSTSALVSHDGGRTFTSMIGLPNRTGYGPFYNGYSSSLIAFAPASQIAYFAGGAVYKTSDAGNTWGVLSGSPANASGVAVSYRNPEQVYAANSTGLFISSDAGASWSLAHQIGTFPDIYLPQSVVVNPQNDSFVVVADLFCMCFWRSTDGGFHMIQLTTDFMSWLGTSNIYSYLLPSGRVALVMMTGSSVYASFDYGATWAQFASGLPGNSLTSFFLSAKGDGFVATYGYGLWAWRNLSAALDVAPIQGPISAHPPESPSSIDWVVCGVSTGLVAAVVYVVLIRRRRRQAKEE